LKRRRATAFAFVFVLVLVAAAGTGSAASGLGSNAGPPRTTKRVCAGLFARFASCGAAVVADGNSSPLAGSSPPAAALGPAQFHTAYNLPTTAPSGGTIAIVDAYDDPAIEADLAAYDAEYGLPACTTANGCFRKVNQYGGSTYPAADGGWSLEIALDVEIAHAICQNCKIVLVEASSNSFADLGVAENEAVALGADAISNSWGGHEYWSETNDEAFFHHPGVAIVAATGDSGYGPQFPASSRYVTAVGGTTLSLTSNGGYLGETAWSGAGSGCSAYISKPAWQTDNGCGRRSLADVSADANPNTGAAVFDSVPYSGQTGWFQVGGTSLGSPLIAATYLLAGATAGIQDASRLYAHADLLHDVTSGSNGRCSAAYLCTARVGYDGPTGLGTPNGLGAFAAAGGPPPPSQDFSLDASPAAQTVTAGTGTSYTIDVPRTGGFPGTVGLSLAGLPAGASSAFAPVQVDASTASSNLTINTTAAVVPGSYPLTVTGTSGATKHSTTATLVVQPGTTPDFAVAVSPASRTVTAGGGTSYAVSLTRTGGFSGTVDLTTSGLPGGISSSFSPSSVSGSSSTLTLTTGALIAPGSYPFMITGASGSLVRSVGATLVVQPSASADFSISVTPSSAKVPSTGSTNFTVDIVSSGGFSGQVLLATSLPPRGMSFSFSPNPTSSSSILTLTTSGVGHLRAPSRITITGTSGALSHSVTLSISV
jgi:hypothetical protein